MTEEKQYFISDLVKQEEPDPEDVARTIKEYAETGMLMNLKDIQQLLDKTRLSYLELTSVYQKLAKAAKDNGIPSKVKQGYQDSAQYIKGKIDQINPTKNGNK